MIKACNFTKKDEINSVSATPLQQAKNENLTIAGCAITLSEDEETHEEKKVGLLSTAEHGMMSTISGTALKSLDIIIDYMEDIRKDDPDNFTGIVVKVKVGKSNAGREFITLELV